MSETLQPLLIRRATPADAEAIAGVMSGIARERVHSAIDQAWEPEQQRSYLESLSPREAVHVACSGRDAVIGFQVLDLWSPVLTSMSHVGQIGTFIRREWRGRGAGRRLWAVTEAFARAAGYGKLIVQVRASNAAAQAFYASIGFVECGRLSRQVIIDSVEDDEVLMERFLD